MNVLTAAQTVLAEAGEPLSVKEIMRRILERQLWTPGGKTPIDTLHGRLSVDIKQCRHQAVR